MRGLLGIVALLAASWPVPARSQPVPPAATPPEARPVPDPGGFYELKKAAADYRMAEGEGQGRPLTLLAEPVLRWTNPLRQTDDSAVFLWTAGGRPVVIASFYRFRRNGGTVEDHEFHSLGAGPVVARKDGDEVWSPMTSGVTFQPIPDAPKPAASPADRARQARMLARDFRAFIDTPTDQGELRLLSKPLYRYEDGPREGALFAFVQATDPEVILWIESRPVAGAPAWAWHYALARMTIVNVKAQYRDRDVWRVGWVDDTEVADRGRPYFVNRDVGGTGR